MDKDGKVWKEIRDGGQGNSRERERLEGIARARGEKGKEEGPKQRVG